MKNSAVRKRWLHFGRQVLALKLKNDKLYYQRLLHGECIATELCKKKWKRKQNTSTNSILHNISIFSLGVRVGGELGSKLMSV